MPEQIRKIDDEKMGVTQEAVEEVFLKSTLLKQKTYFEQKLLETEIRLGVFKWQAQKLHKTKLKM